MCKGIVLTDTRPLTCSYWEIFAFTPVISKLYQIYIFNV